MLIGHSAVVLPQRARVVAGDVETALGRPVDEEVVACQIPFCRLTGGAVPAVTHRDGVAGLLREAKVPTPGGSELACLGDSPELSLLLVARHDLQLSTLQLGQAHAGIALQDASVHNLPGGAVLPEVRRLCSDELPTGVEAHLGALADDRPALHAQAPARHPVCQVPAEVAIPDLCHWQFQCADAVPEHRLRLLLARDARDVFDVQALAAFYVL
mmetsp:Transcript_69275/g.151270  ORF Transcript_69275/g.151270 Transcript_69275/m.151270 type:complete len:214 (-) Transcript_69275:1757-2398(-)